MAAPGDRRRRQSCPCLFSDDAPICRADLKALHVPPRSHLERYCGRPRYRQCALYRAWLETLREAPDRWNGDIVAPEADGGTRLAPNGAGGNEAARKEDLMLTVLRKLISDERAQDLAEYGIVLGVLAAGVMAVALSIQNNITTLWTVASGIIAAAA